MGTRGLKNSPADQAPGRLSVARELLLLALGRRQRLRVANLSMWPTLQPGDHLLVDPRAYRRAAPQAGDLVVARHHAPPEGLIVKRVASADGGQLRLASDNTTDGHDSRHFGSVPADDIVGRVTAVI